METLDAGRPYGTTRADFLAICDGKMTDWVEEAEKLHGVLERISTVHLKDGRIVMLGKFERSWYVNLFNPGNKASERELHCFLSFEAMCAFWGLHQYLCTAQTNEQAWQAFMDAVIDHPGAQEAP
jgi:hypothetical protein